MSGAQEKQNTGIKNVGSACFEEPAWPNKSINRHLCMFELNTVNPFYPENRRMEVIKNFAKSQHPKCEVSDGIEMMDPKADIDHAMFLIFFRISCV